MSDRSLLGAYIALIVVCVVWGTTYYALLIGVETFPPFLFSAIRQLTAGLFIMISLKFLGKLKFSKSDFIHQSIPGILMISLGNGVIGWAERYIPSGLAALIVSILPVYIVGINFFTGADKQKPNRSILLGLLLGCIGIFLMFRDNLKDLINPQYLLGMIVAFLACLAWAFGSVYAKAKPSTANVLTNASIQMLSGGIGLFVMSFFLDDYSELKSITSESLWALAYLTVFGSIITYSCFVYALQKLPLGVASLYAYVNPFIALLLGFFLLNESITWVTGLALIAALTGIYYINKGYQLQKK